MTRKHEHALDQAVQNVATALGSDTVGEILARLRSAPPAFADAVCVINAERRLLRLVPTPDLLRADPAVPIAAIATQPPPSVRDHEDQERVAHAALRHHVSCMPVVDASGVLLGVVPSRTLMSILYREHAEDLHRLAGIRRETAQAREALEEPPTRQAIHRLPWILVGFAGSVLATFIMSRFQKTLEATVAVAFFVPGLVYLADAVGTQTEAIAVRGLSLSRQSLRRLLAGELGAGVLIGVVLGALALPLVWLMFGDVRLAAAVSSALVAAGVVATAIGLLLPWGLHRAGIDPAFGSGPLATIVQDVTTILIYFAMVVLLIR